MQYLTRCFVALCGVSCGRVRRVVLPWCFSLASVRGARCVCVALFFRQDSMRLSNAVVQICGVIYEVVGAFKTEAPHIAAFALETLRR